MVFLVIPSIPSLDGANSPNHVTYHPILYIINFLFFIFSHHFKSHMLPISPGGLSSNIIDSISFFLIKKKIITNVFFPLLKLRIPRPIKKMVWDGMTFYAISLVCWCLIWPLEGLWRLQNSFKYLSGTYHPMPSLMMLWKFEISYHHQGWYGMVWPQFNFLL